MTELVLSTVGGRIGRPDVQAEPRAHRTATVPRDELALQRLTIKRRASEAGRQRAGSAGDGGASNPTPDRPSDPRA